MVGIFWVVVRGDGWWCVYCHGGEYILRGSWWCLYFGRWWLVVGFFWMVMGGGGFFPGGGGSRWVYLCW